MISMMSVLECRTEITNMRNALTNYLLKCKREGSAESTLFLGLLEIVACTRDKLTEILKLIPKGRLYVTNYRFLAYGINVLRSRKVLQGSPELIVRCCIFVCNFTEPDFSRHRFLKLIANFNPELDEKPVNEGEK